MSEMGASVWAWDSQTENGAAENKSISASTTLLSSVTDNHEPAEATPPSNNRTRQQKMEDPSLLTCFCQSWGLSENEFSLSGVPWRLNVLHSSIDDSDTQDCEPVDMKPSGNRQDGSSYPDTNVDYLDLRRRQNSRFCQDRLEEGIQFAKRGELVNAERSYRQGLELMEDHTDLLVAYGALQANKGAYGRAISLLDRALALQPQHVDAARYREDVLQAAERSKRRPAYGNKSAAALRDALQEQSIVQGGIRHQDLGELPPRSMAAAAEVYSMLPSDSEEDKRNGPHHSDQHERKARRKHTRKEHRKIRKRRKRRRYETDSSEDASEEGSEHRSKRNRKYEKKRRKKSRRRDNASDSSPPSDGTVDSLKIARKRRDHR